MPGGTEPPLGPITIGAREIYDAVVELRAITGDLRAEQLRQRDELRGEDGADGRTPATVTLEQTAQVTSYTTN